jgi:hypothetical protein
MSMNRPHSRRAGAIGTAGAAVMAGVYSEPQRAPDQS